jgi:peroxiredoxin Q/BCP
VVYGVSKDSTGSHARFRQKYSLNFPLLSDPELHVHKAYGAWGEKVMYGKPMVGVIRSTFLVGKDGRIARSWPRVKVDGHVDEVLRALDTLG